MGEEQFAFDRMVAQYVTRSRTWKNKLQGNPLAVDQLAVDNKAYRMVRQREKIERRHKEMEEKKEKDIRFGLLQRAAAEDKADDLVLLRTERRQLLEMERILRAKRDNEKFEERVKNMGPPRRCVKYLTEKKEKKKVEVETAAPISNWSAISVIEMATQIMEVADKGSKNGLVSVGELLAFLSGDVRYKPFLEWLMADGKKRFREFDKDKSGDMSLPELHNAVHLFVGEKQEEEKKEKAAKAGEEEASPAEEATLAEDGAEGAADGGTLPGAAEEGTEEEGAGMDGVDGWH